MSARIEEWLTRMREAATPNPGVRITAAERGRDLGWVFDLAATTSEADIAETIDRTGRPYTTCGVSSFFHRIVEEAGITDFSLPRPSS